MVTILQSSLIQVMVGAVRKGCKGVARDFSFIERQKGMFSYSGIELERVRRLRSEFGLYIVDSGRICVAAMNEKNLDYVTDSIKSVL